MSLFPARRTLALILLVLAYFAAGRLGLSLAFVHASTSAVWPPAGIAVGALLLLGLRAWPAVTAGAFLVNITTSGAPLASAAIAAGNTLEAVSAAWLCVRFADGTLAFERTRSIFFFAVVAALPAAAVGATVGTAALELGGLAGGADAASIWVTWWLGDAVGILMTAPLLVIWSRPSSIEWTQARPLELVVLAACLGLVGWIVFGDSPSGALHYPVQFLVMPILLWAAFRFGARETITAAAVLSVIANAGTVSGLGPFSGTTPNEALLLLQAYIGVTTVAMLSVAAEIAGRRRSESEFRALNDALERRVAARTDELSRMHGRLVDAQQVAHVGSWEWDVETNTLWWSDELYRIYGLDPAEGTSYERFIARVHPGDRPAIEQAVGQAAQDGHPFKFDHRICRPDGTIRMLHAEGRVVMDTAGRCVRMMGIGHDITERKHAEEERAALIREQAARREAEESSQLKDRFLAVLSHELRTPLNAALGWAQTLRHLPPDDERIRHAADAILRNLMLQTRLVSDILDVSRITSGRLPVERYPIDLADVVNAAVETAAEAGAVRGVIFSTRMSSEPMVVLGDARRLQQVIWNLLDNAAKFSGSGTVEIAAAPAGGHIEMSVSDEGPGIPDDFLPHVFEQFRQADPSVTREHGGLGLGLAIARHIVELHGGTISAANRQGGGAVFRVMLPSLVAVIEERAT